MADLIFVFASNVRTMRIAKNLSQESLALEAAIDRTYISGIERGKRNPSLKLVEKLAKCLGCEPADLLRS